MRLAFVAAYIPVFALVASTLARHMAKPTVGAWKRWKRGVRYMHGHNRWVNTFPIQDEAHRLDVYTDSNRAQDPDRKGCIMRGDHDGHTLCAGTSCNTNGTNTLTRLKRKSLLKSTEYQLELVCKSMARDMGRKVSIGLHTDSTASKDIASIVGPV